MKLSPHSRTMKPMLHAVVFALLAIGSARGLAQEFAPSNLGGHLFSAVIESGTGGAAGSGQVRSLLAADGLDYVLGADGDLSSPRPYAYVRLAGSTARIDTGARGTMPAAVWTLTFGSARSGVFSASQAGGGVQTGAFVLAPVALPAPLVNVSTRTLVPPNGTAVTGFVIAGASPRRVLIRAVGPTLVLFGVREALPNPSIAVWRGTTVVATNDDWNAGVAVDASLPEIFRRVGAFSLVSGTRDSALVLALAPGAYTASIRGANATETGEVLLEVYFID